MNVDAQWLTAHLLGMDAGRVGEPVVCVDDVEFLLPCDDTGDDGVVVDFLVQVFRVASGKLHAAQVVDVHVVEVGVDMIAQLEVEVGVHDVAHAALYVVAVDVAPGYGHGVHGYDAAGLCWFVAEGVR